MKPLIAIVGRPNVGKSTLFNRIAGDRISIVEDTPGVTRDRIYADSEWCGHAFTLIDTGGLELKSEDEMWSHIRAQVEIAVEAADAIVYVVDGKTGLTLDDEAIAAYLRGAKVPVILAVNKIDNNELHEAYRFYSLGFGDPHPVSAAQGKGIGDLLDAVIESVPAALGYERVIVSNIAGTTRDAIDTPLTVGGDRYVLIDTAGIRRKKSVGEGLEKYSVIRSLLAVRRADVVVVVVDAAEGLTEQDVKIAGYVHEQGKPSVIVMNKWDLVAKDTHTIEKYEKKLHEDLKFMDYFKSVYISALTGKRADGILPACRKVLAASRRRISTGLLNEVLADATRISEPPSKLGKRLKLLYITEVSVAPPTFVLKVNDPDLMHFSYKRYIENALRRSFDFAGTPIRILVRGGGEDG